MRKTLQFETIPPTLLTLIQPFYQFSSFMQNILIKISGLLISSILVVKYFWNNKNSTRYAAAVLSDERDIRGEIAIVTGSNSGIGKQTALELAQRGAMVILACRNYEKAQEAMNDILRICPQAKLAIERIDLADFESVREFAKQIKAKYPRVNILVNNGGIFYAALTHTKDGHEPHMRTNHMGPFLLTNLLLDLMKKPVPGTASRIIFIGSSSQVLARLDLNDLHMKNGAEGIFGFLPYSNSKLANALFSRELGNRLKGSGINSYALCPGLVETDLARHVSGPKKLVFDVIKFIAMMNVREGCKTIMHCALSKSLENESGQFYRFLRHWDPGHEQYSDAFSKRLWDECEKACGL